MKSIKIKSYCKVNLTLRVLKKLNSGYHSISSLITFTDLHDKILISKTSRTKDIISFSGRFQKGIDKKKNTISKLLNLLRQKKMINKQMFKINIEKNIPHGSGLGGGSSNAAVLLNYFNSKMKMNLSKEQLQNLAFKIGSDVPIILEKKNTFLTGKKNIIMRINQNFRLNLLIVYPGIICSTKKIYKNNKKNIPKKTPNLFKKRSIKNLLNLLKNNDNDLQETVIKIYPKIKKIIDLIKLQNGCYLSRITGSGSACIGIFSTKKNAIYAQKMIKLKFPKYWSFVSKTI